MVSASEESKRRIYNLSSEKLVNLKEIVCKIMKYTNSNNKKIINKKMLRSNINEVNSMKVSSKLIQKLLGWNISTSMDEGLQETIQWYQDNPSQ